MWFTIGFVIACIVGVYLVSGVWLLLIGAFSLVAMLGLLMLSSEQSRKVVCVLLGCVVGFVWLWGFDLLYLKPARQMDEQIKILSIEVTDYSRSSPYGITAEGKTVLDEKTYWVQFYINETITLSPGDRVEGGFRLRYTGGGAKNPTYHRGNGVFLLCYPKGEPNVIQQSNVPARYFAAELRERILNLLDAVFPQDTAPFAKALLLGDTEGLTYETKSALKVSGIYHVVAVSGLHVSILFALVYLLCGKQRVLTALIGIPVLILFAAVAGFSPSVVRACIMQILMILALLVNKEYDPPTALAAAVLALLASNPLSITSISLQLSVCCVMGILLFTQRIQRYLLSQTRLGPAKGKGLKARLIRWAVGSVSVSLGALSITIPLCAIYFGCISVVSVLTNLLMLWLVSLIFYGIMVILVFCAFWLPAGSILAAALSYPIRLILWVTDMISKVPVSAVYTASVYIVAWLILAYVLLAIFLKSKKKYPVVLTCCLLAGLVVAIACSWFEPRLDNFRITAVDVGQGQCIILQNEGKYYMVDCGGDSDEKAADEAAKLLLSQGVFRLDGVIITHYDADHAGGVEMLLSRIPADEIYLPILEMDNDIRDSLTDKYADKICWVEEDTVFNDVPITIYPAIDTQDTNESSLCILFQPENCDILITGDRSTDGELALMEHTQLPDLEILIAGHHGSKTSTSLELLNATRPELVIISVGEDNRYGHPTWETLERLRIFGCDVYRTDTQGTIIFRG